MINGILPDLRAATQGICENVSTLFHTVDSILRAVAALTACPESLLDKNNKQSICVYFMYPVLYLNHYPLKRHAFIKH